jgi:hypothetical protein
MRVTKDQFDQLEVRGYLAPGLRGNRADECEAIEAFLIESLNRPAAAAPVAMPRRQFGGQIELKREFLVGRQRLKRAADRLGDVLNGIIGQFEHQLASFDDPGSYL